MNTLAGFACSVGVDMGYNSNHHKNPKVPKHSHCKGHHKQKSNNVGTVALKDQSAPNDDCCSNDVAKFTLLDKSIVSSFAALNAPIVLATLPDTFYSARNNTSVGTLNKRFQLVRRSCCLHDIDIRISIQSFQI